MYEYKISNSFNHNEGSIQNNQEIGLSGKKKYEDFRF